MEIHDKVQKISSRTNTPFKWKNKRLKKEDKRKIVDCIDRKFWSYGKLFCVYGYAKSTAFNFFNRYKKGNEHLSSDSDSEEDCDSNNHRLDNVIRNVAKKTARDKAINFLSCKAAEPNRSLNMDQSLSIFSQNQRKINKSGNISFEQTNMYSKI